MEVFVKRVPNYRWYKLFYDIEMPVVTVTAEMQNRGFALDFGFAQRMSEKFHKKLDEVKEQINIEMAKYEDDIRAWRETPAANVHPIIKGKQQKSLSEKLSNPVELTSPTQLGIFLYDVLHVLKAGNDNKEVTDEASLIAIKDKLPLAGLILKLREYEKLLGTYIDAIPAQANPYDNRLHAKFNQMGRDDKTVVTGRMSSTEPNLQNLPARSEVQDIRCMFIATTEYPEIEITDNVYEVPIENEVLLQNGEYHWSSEIKQGDILENGEIVKNVTVNGRKVYLQI